MMPLRNNGFEKARARMVQEQLVPRGINDPAVLKAMGSVPRHLFVEDALQSQAYGDFPLPIGEGQTISQPSVVALMTQLLELRGHEKVLEIGTGCGYQTAVLASMCQKIFTVERIKSLLARTRRIFDHLQLYNIISKIDDGTEGWPQYQPFDAIIVTAAGPRIPEPLIAQLADPGILVMPVDDQGSQVLTVVSKKNGDLTITPVENVRFVKLIGSHGWTVR
jgi:protein-L-isoaspartate(D-aspartate) O-methyltransferase